MATRIRFATAFALTAVLVCAVPAFAAVPDNDDMATPVAVGSLPFTNGQDTTEATLGANDPQCFGDGVTVWYEFTAADTGWYQVDTFGSDYDTTLHVGTPDGLGGIDLISCVDDSSNSLQSRIAFEAQANTTYLFMVGSCCEGPGGNLVLNVDTTEAPIPLVIDITADPTGHFLRDGRAVIGGTISCNEPAFAYASLSLRQTVGRISITGWAELELDCTPDGARWEATLSGNGRFAGGNAQLQLYVDAFAPDKEQFASTELASSIRLRK